MTQPAVLFATYAAAEQQGSHTTQPSVHAPDVALKRHPLELSPA